MAPQTEGTPEAPEAPIRPSSPAPSESPQPPASEENDTKYGKYHVIEEGSDPPRCTRCNQSGDVLLDPCAPEPRSVDKLHDATTAREVTINALMLAEAAVMLKNAHIRHVLASIQILIEPTGIMVQGVWHGRAAQELVPWEVLNGKIDGDMATDDNPLVVQIRKVAANLSQPG